MSDDIFDRTDLDGADYQARRGAALGATGESGKCIAWVNTPLGAFLDHQRAAELATFLLAAAGPDAAREALAKLVPDALAAHIAHFEELAARASLAEKRLAAVLALTTEELAVIVGRVTHEVLKSDEDDAVADAILDLIRSRATEGAEAPTGATI